MDITEESSLVCEPGNFNYTDVYRVSNKQALKKRRNYVKFWTSVRSFSVLYF